MILLGFRAKRKRLGTVRMLCSQCRNTCSHAVARVQRWITLFLIPMFPFSSRHYTVCSMCSATTWIDRARAEALSRMGDERHGRTGDSASDGTHGQGPSGAS